MNRIRRRAEQRGAVLVIGLVILLLLTVLAIASMNTVATELILARNDRNHENAFQAAEAGLEQALSLGRYETSAPIEFVRTSAANTTVSVVVEFMASTQVPDGVVSVDESSSTAAYHFVATATAIMQDVGSGSPVSAVHQQAFYVLGPAIETSGDSLPTSCVGAECFDLGLPNDPVRTHWVQDGVQ